MEKIKICHVTSAHPRYDGRILYKECASLASAGYDVTLLVCDNLKNENINKVKIISTKKTFNTRIQRLFKSKKILLAKIKEIDAEVFHLHDPDLLRLKKYLNKAAKKVVFDSHEDYPVLISDKKWIPNIIRPIISSLYGLYEKKVLKKIDGVITVASHIKRRLEKINKNTILITNYPLINKAATKNIFKREICFAGGIKDYWNHKNIILAIAKIDNVKYMVAGKGDQDYIEQLKKLNGYEKVSILGYLKREDVIKLYSESSIGLCICSYISNVGFKEGSLGVTKLFEYMANGLPIICTDFDIFKDIIDKYKCGYYVNPNDIDEIENKINLILNDDKLKKEMSKNAFKASREEFNWGSQETKLIEFYKNLFK